MTSIKPNEWKLSSTIVIIAMREQLYTNNKISHRYIGLQGTFWSTSRPVSSSKNFTKWRTDVQMFFIIIMISREKSHKFKYRFSMNFWTFFSLQPNYPTDTVHHYLMNDLGNFPILFIHNFICSRFHTFMQHIKIIHIMENHPSSSLSFVRQNLRCKMFECVSVRVTRI